MPAGHEIVATDLDAYENATADWPTWDPILTSLTLGDGSQVARYNQVGKTVDWFWSFTLGSTSAVGSVPRFTLPVAASTIYFSDVAMGWAAFAEVGTSGYAGLAVYVGSSTVKIGAIGTGGTYATAVDITATVPFTWGSTDFLAAAGRYLAA